MVPNTCLLRVMDNSCIFAVWIFFSTTPRADTTNKKMNLHYLYKAEGTSVGQKLIFVSGGLITAEVKMNKYMFQNVPVTVQD